MRINLIILSIILSVFLSSCTFPKKQKALLKINTDPQASVFINGEKKGSTPYYDDKIKAGEYTIKLVPEDGIGSSWEKRIKLVAGVETQISRKLAQTPDQSNGYDLSMEPSFSDNPSLVVISEPEKAIIKIDGETRGFSPNEYTDLSEGEHTIQISSPGYVERTLRAELFPQYKVNISVQLAKLEKYQDNNENQNNNQSEASSSSLRQSSLDDNLESSSSNQETDLVGKELDPPYVTIGETSTGWLNIRSEPDTNNDNIIKKANPGEKYKYIDKNETGWFKIEIQDGEIGWLSSKYVTLTQ